MGKLQKEGLTKREIKKYVDELIEKNKNSYDARLAPLLYEFFLRSNKTFNWSKDEFLYKYNNFERNINTIKFAKLDQPVKGECDFDNKEIHINENMIDKLNLEEIEPYNELIDVFYHECLHATDYDDKEELKDGLFKIENNKKKTINDSMLNEYGNIIASSLISSDTGLYIKEPLPNLDGYESLHTPGTVFCAAFDISERTIAELKDKGREDFDRYFRKNYPFLKTDYIIEAFTGNLNLMHNAVESEDKEHIKEGYINIFEMGNKILKTRMFEEFKIGADEEFIEKTHYNIIKMYTLMKQSVNLLDIDENSSKKIE
ncbi:MAG: hypothetical protein IKT41_00350, partial [Clostridia bacterium]|nr:hypothetical protein [Clostridia bacterium]